MLEPQRRRLLMEALRPPDGYSLDCAIGTSFSLDLLALLTAPLAFALLDRENAEGDPLVDPLALLDSLRRYSDRIAIFCQAGQISVPRSRQPLFGYLEESVVEVTPRSANGVFHPKIWVLRFTADGSPVQYRLLCLTRNLTFDRSWDTALVLEGEVAPRKNAYSSNHSLGDFLEALPRLALRPASERILSQVKLIQEEVRKVRFRPPEGFSEVVFWPLGTGYGRRWPFEGRIDRMLIISPFLSEGLLERLSQTGSKHVLVSRLESLQAVGVSCLQRFDSVLSLSDAADPEPVESSDPEDEGNPSPEDASLSGLHAKLYVADAGWDSRLWTGSANATEAAFRDNVEFLVELRGKKSACGIEAVLSQNGGKSGLQSLLQPFNPQGEVTPEDPIAATLDRRIQAFRQALFKAGLSASVVVAGGTEFFLRLRPREGENLPHLPSGVSARCWPITLKSEMAVRLGQGEHSLLDFGVVSMNALTSFFAFDVKAEEQDRSACARFVLNLPLLGAPENRKAEILRSLLQDKKELLRFLLLLLSEDLAQHGAVLLDGGRLAEALGGEGAATELAFPLFESLVKALDRNPEKLDQVARLIHDLGDEAQSLFPTDFEQVWTPIWQARGRLAT